MRLIRIKGDELVLEEFADASSAPGYAILSHTWDIGEVTFQDMQDRDIAHLKAGYTKIINCCRQAARRHIFYVWIDTCCIDKSSSAELSEAINSMYQWYSSAIVCFAYLSDVQAETVRFDQSFLSRSKWFTRGWTLQELIAPARVIFFDCEWIEIGTKTDLSSIIFTITAIDEYTLLGKSPPRDVSVARRMSWASQRKTTRTEDIAYCLLGLFEVNMPLIYGEGKKAFMRLQEEIMKSSDDQSLFAWHASSAQDTEDIVYHELKPISGLLASSPAQFQLSADIVPYRNWRSSSAYSMTNQGLKMKLPTYTIDQTGFSVGILSCRHKVAVQPLGVYLRPIWSPEGDQFARCRHEKVLATVSRAKVSRAVPRTIYVRNNPVLPSTYDYDRRHAFFIRIRPHSSTGYRLTHVWPKERWKPEQNIIKAPTRKAAIFFEHGGPRFIVMVRADYSKTSQTGSQHMQDIRCTCKIRVDRNTGGQEPLPTSEAHPLVMMEELARSGAPKTFTDLGDGRRAIAEIQRETWMGEDVFVVDVGVGAEDKILYELPANGSDTEVAQARAAITLWGYPPKDSKER